jgi:hypothetical protein
VLDLLAQQERVLVQLVLVEQVLELIPSWQDQEWEALEAWGAWEASVACQAWAVWEVWVVSPAWQQEVGLWEWEECHL